MTFSMKIKNYILLLAFTFLFVFNGISQTKLSASEQSDFKSKAQKTAHNTLTIDSDSVQTKHISVLDNAITSEGQLEYKAPALVKCEYLNPYQETATFKDGRLL